MVVLGCHISEIQHNRISTAISFINNLEQNSHLWFLTGGVKNAIQETDITTESSQMLTYIGDDNVILDEKARNTAENFANLKKWIKTNYIEQNLQVPNIVITTSTFHKDRAELIFNGVFHDLNVDASWNLASIACSHCWHDEKIHIKNVESDVRNALKE
jgi:hypothetical protein